jgi:hypothetical protein
MSVSIPLYCFSIFSACAPTKDNRYSCTLYIRDSRSVQGLDQGPIQTLKCMATY